MFVFAMTSCSDEGPAFDSGETNVNSESVKSNLRTVEDAIEIASQNYGHIFDVPASRSVFNIDPEKVVVIGADVASRAETTDTALYVVNFGDNNGFAVISANKECTPILAMTDNGEITNVDDIENPGLKIFMNYATAYSIGGGSQVITPPTDPDDGRVPLLYRGEVVEHERYAYGRGVDVAWGQSWPEGYYCPNKTSGCVITAGLQVLSQMECPQSIKMTYSHGQEILVLNWASIKANVISRGYFPQNIESIKNLDDHLALARLSREIGQRVDADYKKNGTFSNLKRLRSFLTDIAPEIEVSGISSKAPKVASMYPRWSSIIMSGTEEEDSETGHVWLIDRYKTDIEHVKIYAVEHPVFDQDGNFVPYGEPTSTYDYRLYSLSHINWGWSGYGNGYYDVDVYDLSKCKEPDMFNPAGNESYSYNFAYFTVYKD